MRNLRNIHLGEVPLGNELPLAATAWDPATDSIICAFGPTETTAVIELKRKAHDAGLGDLELIASWDAPCPLPDLQHDRIVSLQYFADTLVTCLVLEGGDIIVVREDPQPGEDKIEIMGSVDVGITAAAWALDEELLAVTTKSDTLLYMTRDFENVANITFTSDDLKASRHVSVGWGKKETQFQGKRAKALRDPTMPEKIDEGKLSDLDDKRVSISWRGDGAFVAVNSIQSDARRVIRVYSRDGVLDSVSEPVDGLEGSLSWRPSGNLIAGIQRMEDRVDVVFFERNGLRHGEFTLRVNKEDMQTWASKISLAWNIDSTVLSVQFKDRIQLWTMGNYHYYLKQEIPISVGTDSATGLLCFRWHQEKALRFVIGSSDTLFDTEYVFDVARGSTLTPNDCGAVAVIDGRSLKLTPLKLSNVPPPMAACDILLESNAIDVAFSKSSTQFAVLTMAGIYLYSWDIKVAPVADPELKATYPILNSSSRPRRITFLEEKEIYVLSQHGNSQENVEKTDIDTKETTIVYQSNDSSILSSIFPNLQQNSLWICQEGLNRKAGSYIKLSPNGANGLFAEIPHESPSQETCWAYATELSDGEEILFSLSKSGALYANKRLLAKNCTSFIISGAHLIFTTTQHLLKFVHIGKVDDLDIPGDIPETDERCRSIERGARLVSVMPSIFAVTLQMPRGNTETIYPRALVLAGIRKYIDNKKYRAAYLACRSHMVDMNILHDYSPPQFMANVPLFIDQVKKIEYIDEFLSRLRDEDVSETLYKNTLKIAVPDVAVSDEPNGVMPGDATKTTTKDNKVNRICDAFLSVLNNRIDTNLQNLVTAHVCKSPPDLDSGLQLVAKLREQSTEQAEEAIEHMCFLTDAYRLYDHALGLYDLELTLMVAQQAQKDPREYLPFLQKLQAMPELRRQYEIDNHLGRVRKAIKTLHALHAYDELKLYAIKHTLYSDALELYKYQPELLRDMSHLYADYLYDQSNYKEAAIIYESLSLYEPAYQSYQLAHQWRECIYCASLVPLPETQMNSLLHSLASTLTAETKDYISAAHIHAEHLQDIPTAARLLCRGNQFGDACRLLVLHDKQSLVSEIVDSALGDAMGSMIDLLADCKAQLNAQVPRIQELRVRRATDPLGFYGGDPAAGLGEGGVDIPDNVSLAPTDATTMAGRSMFTRYTGNTSSSRKTSKTRRREERKRARGKKGTVYEEEYLVNSVRRLIERVNSAIDEGEGLIQALLRRGMRERAGLVQHHMDEVLGMCRDCLDDVFEVPKGVGLGVNGADAGGGIDEDGGLGMERPSGGDGVFWDSLQQTIGGRGREPPVVKGFKKLAILGG
ncbi:elongator complex protein 1 [Blastomyces silverae]|uniref:Elongator complex protein 1 n=1 Tax=Blastomyces silverae TaxID=2060906 RepID=A0A0H1BG36_9EURO|nr:elongator complex protein 1 [Blastomyces silverae]